ncbi:hypothetical protein [Psychrobacillus vulpis]|uniref:Uncharacterized protein n=1 Tax=Psychrobacillus vulpis TaxID=2325572 RepID=A0A544TSY0_9BACI|nr:hypothetical protein [Psychrobacillus vulpis]TQR20545.1 hypothetical protein FG384_07280 [Psychrobacillus vulpis]
MTKKKLLTFIGSIVLVLATVIIYWFYFSKPTSFPNNEQLVKEMNSLFPECSATVIQDIVQLDEHHVFVPFISEENNYGLSFWVWKHHKWKIEAIDTNGNPRIWKINSKDPSTYHFVWNFPSTDYLNYMKLYLIKKRGYHISGNIHHYNPAVQMEEKIVLPEQNFGSLQVPDEWVAVINSMNELNSAKQPDIFFINFFPQQDMYFGWNTFDISDNITHPERLSNSSSFWNEGMDIEYMIFVNDSELEFP